MATEKSELRKRLDLAQLGQVAPVLLLTVDEKPALVTCFRCIPCGDLMEWAPEGDCWSCRCGYQLDKGHAVDLLDNAIEVLAVTRSSLTDAPLAKAERRRKKGWLNILTWKKGSPAP